VLNQDKLGKLVTLHLEDTSAPLVLRLASISMNNTYARRPPYATWCGVKTMGLKPARFGFVSSFSHSQSIVFLAMGLCISIFCAVCAQLCLTLCDPMDCSPPGSSVHGDSPGKNTGVGCHALLQGIFPTQGANPGLPHRRQSHQGSPHLQYQY